MGTLIEESPLITRPVLGGRSSVMSNATTAQTFGQIATDPAAPATTMVNLDTEIGDVGKLVRPPRELAQDTCQRLWRVRTAGVELVTFGNGQTALTREAILAAQTQDGRGQVIGVKALVKLGTNSGNTIFRMDIGQAIDVRAFSIDVGLLSSVGAGQVGSVGTGAVINGTASNAVVGWDITMIENTDDHTEVRYSQLILIAAAAVVTVEVPTFATQVRVNMVSGVSAAPWTKTADAGGVYPTGPVEFNAGGTISTTESGELGNARFLRTNAFGLGVRSANITWTIRP